MENIREEKKRVRKMLKEITAGLSEGYKREASEIITRKVLALKEYQNAGSIFLFINMKGEPDTSALIAKALADGKKVYVPRCLGGGIMESVRLRSMEDVQAAPPYGIPEPKKEIPATDPAEYDAEETLALVPCMGGSRDGRRIGHGVGYYDRFLEGRKMRRVMLVFEKQILEDIPCDQYDLRMDRVISEGD